MNSAIPVPKPSGAQRKYDFHDLLVGASIPVSAEEQTRFRHAVAAYSARTGKKFTVRKFDDAYRCWRIADDADLNAEQFIRRVAGRGSKAITKIVALHAWGFVYVLDGITYASVQSEDGWRDYGDVTYNFSPPEHPEGQAMPNLVALANYLIDLG